MMPFPCDEKLSYFLVLCSLVIPTETIPKQQIFANSERANFCSEYRNKLSVNANFRSKFRNELSVKANFRSKIRVNYNNRHCENSANFLRTFALDKNSPFFVEKPRNSRISSNYVLITFSQYCSWSQQIFISRRICKHKSIDCPSYPRGTTEQEAF